MKNILIQIWYINLIYVALFQSYQPLKVLYFRSIFYTPLLKSRENFHNQEHVVK